MNKKKLVTLLVASVLTVTIVGGTLAWFTSSDSVTNKFSISDSQKGGRRQNPGIKIHEKFDSDDANKMTPGKTVEKKVQVYNVSKYEQFIRVKLTKQFKDSKGTVISENLKKPLDLSKIQLSFTNNLKPSDKDKSELTSGSWYYNKQDGYYYYIGKVTGETDTVTGENSCYTNTLLDSVTLSDDAGNEYKNLTFDVVVEADSIQASNDAYKDWTTVNLQNVFGKLQEGNITKPTDKIIDA